MTYDELNKKIERKQNIKDYIEAAVVGIGFTVFFFAVMGACIGLLTGCGTDNSSSSPAVVAAVTDGQTDPTEAMAISTSADLPECGAENEDQLILTRDDKLFHVCEDGAWISISFGGNGITEQYVCGGSDDLDPGTNSVYGTYLNATKFENGDWHLSCGASHSLFYDDASYDVWFSAASQGVYNGEITCIPPYVYAKFNIDNGTVTYTKSTDSNLYETLECTKIN